MNLQLSNKIKIISFITMIMVLFIHSFNLTLISLEIKPENSYSYAIQNFISFHICRIAVPFFFILSGFLFINKLSFSAKDYFEKIKIRFKTLVIPYLVWITLWTLLFTIFSNFPLISSYINSPINFNTITFYSILDVLNSPICYQFWFIKDLIFLVLFSPLLFIAIKKMPFIFISLLYINLVYFEFGLYFFQLQSILYFSIGFCFAIYQNNINLSEIKMNYKWIGIIWTLLYFFTPNSIVNFVIPFIVIIGIFFLWKVYDAINQKNSIYLYFLKWSKYSFFLFAFHEPLQISFKKIGFIILGKTEAVSLVLYFLIPILVFFISINVGILTQKLVPKLYAVLTGGR